MARILCIDFGLKRCGIATTDPLQIIATGLKVVTPQELIPFLKQFSKEEEIEMILIGLPVNLDGSDTHATDPAQKMYENIRKELPAIPVKQIDERMSSKYARRAMHEMGMKKSQKKKKENVDLVAATMLLQDFLEERQTG